MADGLGQSNRRMLGKLAVIATVMFGFGWALIPIYKKICEVTGVNSLTRRDEGAAQFARNTQVDSARTVTVEFDANSHGPWSFRPETRSMSVHPGQLVTINYDVVNTLDQPMAGQAIPSYAPIKSAEYFRKVECFCFAQQSLGANEARRFPVVFVIDPKLPKDVDTITLSYTFFAVAGPAQGSTDGNPALPAQSRGG